VIPDLEGDTSMSFLGNGTEKRYINGFRSGRNKFWFQNLLKREGLSNKTMKENIDTFEDVPAYIRRNMSLGTAEKNNESKLSKFTLSSNENNEPLLRENNAYLNDNVD
jgi:hypothetical protein